QSIQLLEAVPPSSGSVHLQANQELQKIYPQLAAIQKRISLEEEAEANLQTAQELVAQATEALKKSPPSPEAGRQAEAKLKQAIQLVKAIRKDTFVYETAKQKAIAYQTLAEKATQQINSNRKQPSPKRPQAPKTRATRG
ncbi:MAG: hypothetical protein SFW36_05110, partial [Leptolyngbyaceae cyanobacterium bins.59]|nr:hypothetical protein [Leptolyngbyaceae cyanobacterium bins.59]